MSAEPPAGAARIGTVASIVRYPVESMAGEPVRRALITQAGVAEDRLYAFESSGAPAGMLRLTGRERREMLRYRPRVLADGTVMVSTPTGEDLPVESAALLAYLQQHVPEASDFSLVKTGTPQTDVRPLSLISSQTVAQLGDELGEPLDTRRFRANLYLDLPAGPFTEDTLVGSILRIGSAAELLLLERDPRCRFITYDPEAPQAAEPLFALMKLLDRRHQGRAGVYASVVTAGAVEVDDPVWVLSAFSADRCR